MIKLLPLLLWLLPLFCQAQIPSRPNLYDEDHLRLGEWVLLYDSAYSKKVNNPDSAHYYCLTNFEDGNPTGKVTCYYANGIKQWDGQLLSVDPDVKHGKCTFYYDLGNVQEIVNYDRDSLVGDYIDYHANGKVQSKGKFLDNKQEGEWQYYHSNGQLQAVGSSKNGLPIDRWNFYHPNGKIQAEKGYIKGEYHGLYRDYHENGNLNYEGEYLNGKESGHIKYYHANSQMESEGNKLNGEANGKWQYYYTNGVKESDREFEKGNEHGYFIYYYDTGVKKNEGEVKNNKWFGKLAFYHPNGKIKSQGESFDGKYQGKWNSYYEAGEIHVIKNYKDDLEHGPYEYYATNGTLINKGLMQKNKMDGYWEFHLEDGSPSYNGTYKDGVKHGKFEYYHTNRKLKSAGSYVNGELQGHWEYYYNNEQLQTKGEFVDNKSEGHWKYYYADGTLQKEGDEHLNKKQGYWKYYTNLGILKSEGVLKDDKREGVWKYYYPNRNLKSLGNTKNDSGQDLWIFYDSLGRIDSKGRFSNGVKDSTWTYYDTLGRIKEYGPIVNNKAHGTWWVYKEGKKDHKEIYDRSFLLNFRNLSDSSQNLANRQEKDSAIWLSRVAKKQWKKEYKKGDEECFRLWRDRGAMYRYLGDYEKAKKNYLKALAVIDESESDSSFNYAVGLSDLGLLYSEMKKRLLSIKYYNKSLRTFEKSKSGRESDNYFYSLITLAQLYSHLNKVDSATHLLKAEITYREELSPDQRDNIVSAHMRLVEIYDRDYQYDSALKAYEGYSSYLKKNNIEDHVSTSEAYRYAAYAYNGVQERDSGLFYFKKSIESFKSQNRTNTSTFVLNYIDLVSSYISNGKYGVAEQYVDTALYYTEKNNLLKFDVHVEALSRKAQIALWFGRSQEAVDYYEMAIKTIFDQPTISKRYLSECYQGLGLCYQNLYPDDTQKAEKAYQQAIDVHENPESYSRDYINAVLLIGGFYRNISDYDNAEKVLLRGLSYYENLVDPSIYYHGRLYDELGQLASDLYQYDSAELYYRKALTFYGTDRIDYVSSYCSTLNRIANNYEDVKMYDKALLITLEALDIAKANFDEDHDTYRYHVAELATLYSKMGDYENAIVLLKSNLETTRKIYGENSPSYVNALDLLATNYYYNDNNDQALQLAEEMKRSIATYAGELHEDYLDYLNVVANVYRIQDNFEESKRYYEQWLSIAKKLYGTTHEEYAYYLRQTGRMYVYFDKYETALPYLLSSVEILSNTQGTQNQKYAWSLETLGEIQYALEQYKEALSANEQIITIYKKVYGEESNYHIEAQSSMANLYGKLGRYNDAEKLYQETLSLSEKSNSKYSIQYVDLLEDLGSVYRWWGKPEKTIDRAILAMSILDSMENNVESKYFGLYNVMGLALQDLGRLDEAEEYYIKAREGALRNWGKTGAYYTYSNNLAFVYLEREAYEVAEELLLEAGSRFEEYEVVNDMERVNFEDNLAALYLAWGKMDLAEKHWTNVTITLLKRINANFTYMSESEKASFWNAYKEDFEAFNSYALKASSSNSEAIGQMYDNQLQTKSILLSSSAKERTRILNSGDSTLIATYYNYIYLKESLAKYYGYTAEQLLDENVQIDSLEIITNDYEQSLSLDASAIANEERAQKVSWKDIQRKLKSNEAAVEIIRFRYFHKHITDSVLYAALILTGDTRKSPELVILPNGNELEDKYLKNYLGSIRFKIDDPYSYDQFWKPIEAKLKDKTKIYLSPDGVYNQLNINTVKRQDNSYVIDSYSVQLLTSTKDIMLLDRQRQETIDQGVAMLFGYPQYNMSHTAIASAVAEQSLTRSNTLERTLDIDSRFGYVDLPGTKTETESIDKILINNSWNSRLYLGDEALEEVVKSVQSPNVLHIATHGFFLDDVAEGKLQLGVNTDRSRKNPLLRSGLLLAGAAQTARGEYDNQTENGILTAYEAMSLNLNGTDLVVLSACETGKGEVKSGEGVYGLQRAFQVAGAESLIMSLWKVNDEATQLLMTNFYQNWINGQSKVDAFKQAQIKVRTQFPEPYYWGAFVMVGK